MSGKPLPGLLQASFRGIPFYIQKDLDHEAGRRLQTTIFPGIDPDTDDDLGKHNGEISVRGFVIGENYRRQEKRLRKAFETAGPGTLIHPWLGEILVILIQPAQFTFSERELRVCRFEFVCKRSYEGAGFLPSSLSGLISALSSVISAGQNLFFTVMSEPAISLAAWSAGRDAADQCVSVLQSHAAASAGSAVFGSAFDQPVKRFKKNLTNELTKTGIAELTESYIAIPGILSASARTKPPAAIGLGPLGTLSVSPGERVGAAVLQQAIRTIMQTDSQIISEQVAQNACELACLSGLAGLITEISFETRNQAKAALESVSLLIDETETRLIRLSPDCPAACAIALTALEQLRAAVSIDMNEIIGRLPALNIVRIGFPVSSFILANHFYGDAVRQIVPGELDLVIRNRPRHPGNMADEIEVLSDV